MDRDKWMNREVDAPALPPLASLRWWSAECDHGAWAAATTHGVSVLSTAAKSAASHAH